MAGNPPDEGIGLLTGEEAAAPAVPKAPAPSKSVAVPAATPAPAAPARKELSGLLTLKAADDVLREVTADTESTLSAVLANAHTESGTVQLTVEIAYNSIYPGEGAEWPVHWLPPGKKSFVELVRKKESTNVPVTPGSQTPVTFRIEAPSGVRFRDRVEVRLAATWNDEEKPSATLTLACSARQSVLAIKSARGYETEVADTLLARAEEKPDVVFALLVPAGLRGYVFAEGMSFEGVREMLHGIRKARGLVAGETTLKEVEPLLLPRITVEGFVEGAIVELIAGPFKGEKARVKKIDQGKEEITVELIEAVVPIPVTVRGDHVRMLEKGGGKSGG